MLVSLERSSITGREPKANYSMLCYSNPMMDHNFGEHCMKTNGVDE